MKKSLAIILAATMAFGLAWTAMADGEDPTTTTETTQETTGPKTGAGSQSTVVEFEIPEKLTWAVPDLSFAERQNDGTLKDNGDVTISNAYIVSSHKVHLKVATKNGVGSSNYLKCGSSSIDYALTLDGENKAETDIALENGAGKVAVVAESGSTDVGTAGNYSDEITYTLTIIDKDPSETPATEPEPEQTTDENDGTNEPEPEDPVNEPEPETEPETEQKTYDREQVYKLAIATVGPNKGKQLYTYRPEDEGKNPNLVLTMYNGYQEDRVYYDEDDGNYYLKDEYYEEVYLPAHGG